MSLANTAPTVQDRNRENRWRYFFRRIEPALYISPAFIVLFIILIYPLGYSFWLSFHEWTLRGFKKGIPFIGLENYIDLFSNPDFLKALRITFTFVILAIGIEFVLGMGLALLLNHELKGRGL
jgi:multiple sugar transport system permease protein